MHLPRPEYPRPHFDRSHSWASCNGTWEFSPDPEQDGEGRGLPDSTQPWPSQITVPFAWETDASGVGAHWLACAWYRRTVHVPPGWVGQRVILHFGAVHHEATVWVNGCAVGSHAGGYTPFELDVTDALIGDRATVVVRVYAPVDKRDIAHGKQRSIPRDDYDGCAFTPSSGIWQPVWLEARPVAHITDLQLRPGPDLDSVLVTVRTAGHSEDSVLSVQLDEGPAVPADLAGGRATLALPVDQPRLWRPEDPHLYDVTATLRTADTVDRVTGHTGLRSISTTAGTMTLNGERLYVRGVLDQGYWPATGITAPDDEAFVTDLQVARRLGFNLVRKHLKLEDPRFLHHADRLGMLIWAEPASTGRFTPPAVEAFEAQIPAMVSRDANHPSIVVWGLYNEEWGLDWDVPGDPAKQQAVRRAFDLLKDLDDSRPAVDNSGWAHVETDLVDWHVYDETPKGWSAKVRALLGGRVDSFPVAIAPDTIVEKKLMAAGGAPPGTLPNLNSEYGGGYTSVERGWNLRWQTQELRRHDTLSGYVWTELTDIEHETAGLVAFDRSSRDLGGNDPATTNAPTVLVVDLTPHSPGVDLVTDGPVSLEVHVSHHGTHPLEARLVAHWGPLLRDPTTTELLASHAEAPSTATITAKPYQLTSGRRVEVHLPDAAAAARLTLALIADGAVVARAAIDVQQG